MRLSNDNTHNNQVFLKDFFEKEEDLEYFLRGRLTHFDNYLFQSSELELFRAINITAKEFGTSIKNLFNIEVGALESQIRACIKEYENKESDDPDEELDNEINIHFLRMGLDVLIIGYQFNTTHKILKSIAV